MKLEPMQLAPNCQLWRGDSQLVTPRGWVGHDPGTGESICKIEWSTRGILASDFLA